MSKALITNSTLTDIADAIRAKGGTSASMLPSSMPAAIEAIPTGPTYTAQDYVSDGCVWLYDAKENIGFGQYSSNPQNWVNLRDANLPITMGNNVFVDGTLTLSSALNFNYDFSSFFWNAYTLEVCLSFNTNINSFTSLVYVPSTTNYDSIEISVARTASLSSVAFCSRATYGSTSRSPIFGDYMNVKATQFARVTDETEIDSSERNQFTCGSNAFGWITNQKSNATQYYTPSTNVFIGSKNNALIYPGKIHCIRLYNRALKVSELKHNYNVDLQRHLGGN